MRGNARGSGAFRSVDLASWLSLRGGRGGFGLGDEAGPWGHGGAFGSENVDM